MDEISEEPQESLEDSVVGILVALKDGIGAAAVGVFDDDQGRMLVSTEFPPAAFWRAFKGLGCGQPWDAWYRDLRTSKTPRRPLLVRR